MKYEILSIPGQKSFAEVHAIQLDLLSKRIADQIPDTYIFCEHTPTVTRGRGLQFKPDQEDGEQKPPRQKPLGILAPGTDYVEIERGGDLTWHGPGQLVIYPIVKLLDHDVEKWIRFLENQWIAVLAQFNISAQTKVGGSGVWITPGFPTASEKKLASVGIALKRWVSYHGIAMNITNDLSGFKNFDPCGYSSEVMTRAQDFEEIPRDYFGDDWRAKWEPLFIKQLSVSLK